MISSLIGATVMSMATVAMLVALNITNDAIKKVGKYPLTDQEKELLVNAGFNAYQIDLISDEIEMLNFDEGI